MLADPNRAALLLELLDGRQLPASELARRVGMSRSLASAHLGKLERTGLVAVEPHGRHRYYSLRNPEFALLLEQFNAAAPARPRKSGLRQHTAMHALSYARSCYDHLAGTLAIELVDAMARQGELEPLDLRYQLLPSGRKRLERLGVEVQQAERAKRAFSRQCLDWTERRPHLAGSLGAALLATLTDRGWLARAAGNRALLVTPQGAKSLRREWAIDVPPDHLKARPPTSIPKSS